MNIESWAFCIACMILLLWWFLEPNEWRSQLLSIQKQRDHFYRQRQTEPGYQPFPPELGIVCLWAENQKNADRMESEFRKLFPGPELDFCIKIGDLPGWAFREQFLAVAVDSSVLRKDVSILGESENQRIVVADVYERLVNSLQTSSHFLHLPVGDLIVVARLEE